MTQHRARGDAGYRVGLAATGLGLATGALIARAHEDGMANVRAHLEARRQAIADARVNADLANGQRMAALAAELADELAAERAENARLRRLLAQRQAYIDGLRQ